MPTKTVRKGLLGLEDLTRGVSTISRTTSTGGTQPISQIPLYVGTGSPQGVLAAAVGSIFLRTDGGTSTVLYVKETGAATSSGWVAK